MSRSPSEEILTGFAEEVRGYIPSLRQGFDSLRLNPNQEEVINELHRLAHTIKGAASLLGAHGLSHTAYHMEEALEDLGSGDLVFSEDTFQVMCRTVDQFEEYCKGLFEEVLDERGMLKEIVSAFRRLRNLPPEEDEEVLNSLLESLPKSISEPSSTGQEFQTKGLDGAPSSEPYPDLMEDFYQEAEEHLDDVGRFLNGLESQIVEPVTITQPQRELVRQLRRSVHTLKGAAAVVGIERVSTWAHDMEDLLDWLYEEAQEITPETINTLVESADILARLVSGKPEEEPSKVNALKQRFKEIMSKPTEVEDVDFTAAEPEVLIDFHEVLKSSETAEDETPLSLSEEDLAEPAAVVTSRPAKTLRVDMERVDELVNLAGELIIALSGFDQKMDTFMDAVSEIELSRGRLREVARNLEVGYEVKAIQTLAHTGVTPVPAVSTAIPRGEPDEFDALELDRYSEFNLIIRTLNESVVDVGAISTHLANIYSEFDGRLTRQRVLLSELQDKMMRVRMIPMSTITNRMHRTVREVANNLGKKVRLIIRGEDIELDRVIWEKLTDPLMHLLRNAVDHGVEEEALRQALEKSAVGTIQVAATHEGNQVVIRITDDGAGLNFAAIRRSIQAAGFSDSAEEISEDELAVFIFQPGFSTRDDISEVSGRGVGLDVVEKNINDLKGTIRVNSWRDKGTQFTIRIPLTLATVRALLFKVNGRVYAVALNEIQKMLRVEPDNIRSEPEDTVLIDEEVLPLTYMARVLNVGKNNGKPSPGSQHPLVLVAEAGGKRGALAIDSLVGQQEIVIKNLGSHLLKVQAISGATIMGDGSVVPIIDTEQVLGADRGSSQTIASDHEFILDKPLNILIVDDSVSIRQVVTRLMENQGWRTDTAKDGIEALEKLSKSLPDLIVLDIEMPRMNGYEFMSALRAEPRYQHIPVVVLTSRTAAKHRAKAKALGAKGFVVKPYDDKEFVDLVVGLSGTSQPQENVGL
jgi:chemosensory pili system protein ChpA (sensor histidine kinase/response regulator)